MMVDRTLDVVRVYDVHAQAREKLFDAVGRLSQEQYVQEFPFAHRTVRATMNEIACTEWWLGARLRGERMPQPFRWEALPINESSYPTFASLKERWGELAPQTRDTLAGITEWDEVIETRLHGRSKVAVLKATRRDIATQILLHEVHHRAQAMTMLRHLGSPVEDLDYIFYVQDEHTEPAAEARLGSAT